MPLTKIDILAKIGRSCKIEPKMKLSGSPQRICPELRDFFTTIINHIGDARKHGCFTYEQIAIALDRLGVQSATGHIVSAAHVCNAVRKSVKRIGVAYKKPNYQGCNHRRFDSKPSPLKEDFASLPAR